MAVEYGTLPFAEALDFFRRKLNLPTKTWDDLLGAAHDRAFVVAGVMLADLLLDLRGAVETALTDGESLETFRQRFDVILQTRGWLKDKTKGYRAWRAFIIYTTNLFTSYSAGRYQQLQEVAAARPYWRYRHSDASVIPRPEHLAWNGVILRYDDPWWSAHYPPSGFGCLCYVESLSAREMKNRGLTVTKESTIPYNGVVKGVDPKTGKAFERPEGVDRGWDYAPGANAAAPLVELLQGKAAEWPPELAQAVGQFLAKMLTAALAKQLLAALGVRS